MLRINNSVSCSISFSYSHARIYRHALKERAHVCKAKAKGTPSLRHSLDRGKHRELELQIVV